MADSIRKKVFSITINGVKESIDAVEALNQQLKALDSNIGKVADRTVRLTTETTERRTVLSGGDAGGSQASSQEAERTLAVKKQITEEERLQAQLARERARTEEIIGKDLRSQKAALDSQKNLTKDIYSGARTSASEYSNTVNGLRAQLRDLTRELNAADLGSDDYKELNRQVDDLTTKIKALESAHGDFRRNVGNYPTAELNAFRAQFESLNGVLVSLVEESNELQRKLNEAVPGSYEYERLSKAIEENSEKFKQAKKAVDDFNAGLNASPKSFSIDVGGTVREFNSIVEAVETLTKELQQMTLEGKEDTAQFNDTIAALGRMKTAIAQTDGEIQSYIGNAKGLSDTVEIMSGMTSIAGLGQGLYQLFGGQNEQLDESIKRFTAITLVMNSLTQIQKSINDGTSIWGTTLKRANGMIDEMLGKLNGTGSISKALDIKQAQADFAGLQKQMKEAVQEAQNLADSPVVDSGQYKEALDALEQYKSAVSEMQQLERMGLAGAQNQRSQAYLEAQAAAAKYKAELQRLASAGNVSAQAFLSLNAKMEQVVVRLNKMGPAGRAAAAGLTSMGAAGRVFALGITAATTALKAFAKATIILAVIQVAFEAISSLVETIGKGLSWLGGQIASLFGGVGSAASQTQESLDSLNTRIDAARDRVSEFNKEIDVLSKKGEITGVEAMRRKMAKLTEEFRKSGEELHTFIRTVDNLDRALSENLGAIGTWYEMGEKSVDDFVKRWNILRKAVEAGTDEVKQGGRGWEWWYTASDAVDDFTDANKAMLQDLAHEMNQINFAKPEQAIEKWEELFKGDIGEARDYAYRNIDKLFPDEPWAQMLKARLDATRDFMDQYLDMMEEAGVETANLHKAAEKAIRDNNAAALPNGKREQQQSRNSEADEIADARKAGYTAEDEEKVITSIRAKYRRQRADQAAQAAKDRLSKAKSAADKLRQVEKQLAQNALAIQKDGLDKQIAQMEASRADELYAAKAGGVKVAELTASINAKYDYQIAKAKEDWYRERKEQQRKWNEEWLSAQAEYARRAQELEEDMRMNAVQRKQETSASQHEDKKDSISYDTTQVQFAGGEQAMQAYRKYYGELLSEQKSYLEESRKLTDEANKVEHDAAVSREAYDYANERAALDKWLSEQQEQQRAAYDKGEVDEEQYRANLETISNTYLSNSDEADRQHADRLSEIEENFRTKNLLSEQQYLRDMKAANKEYMDNAIDMMSEQVSEISELRESQHRELEKNKWGLINPSKEKASLKQAKKSYDDVLAQIAYEYAELQDKFDRGEISFNDFRQAKKELDSLKSSTEDAASEVQDNLKNLGMQFAQNLAETISNYANQIGSLYSTWNDIVTAELDQQQAMLDEKQEMLEEEERQLEEHYQKQNEITDKYTSKIDDIEGELKNARGARRNALIADLQAQKEAQRASLEAEEEIQAEQEQNAQKQEQLKEHQDALDKKRKEQEKRMSIVQATINTATAVTNALSVQPWFVGVALAAVAAALGAVQIAKIKSQKYARGGVLAGPRHSQGGIKVPTTEGMAEVEGGEYIVNREATANNLGLLEAINEKRRTLTAKDLEEIASMRFRPKTPKLRFADGGEMPEVTGLDSLKDTIQGNTGDEEPKEYYVSVVDIINRMNNVNTVRAIAGLSK